MSRELWRVLVSAGHTLFSAHVSCRSWLTLMVSPPLIFTCLCRLDTLQLWAFLCAILFSMVVYSATFKPPYPLLTLHLLILEAQSALCFIWVHLPEARSEQSSQHFITQSICFLPLGNHRLHCWVFSILQDTVHGLCLFVSICPKWKWRSCPVIHLKDE